MGNTAHSLRSIAHEPTNGDAASRFRRPAGGLEGQAAVRKIDDPRHDAEEERENNLIASEPATRGLPPCHRTPPPAPGAGGRRIHSADALTRSDLLVMAR